MNYKNLFLKLISVIFIISCSTDDASLNNIDNEYLETSLNPVKSRKTKLNPFIKINDDSLLIPLCDEVTYEQYLHIYKEVHAPVNIQSYYQEVLKLRKEMQQRIIEEKRDCPRIRIPSRINIFYDPIDRVYKEIWWYAPRINPVRGAEQQDDVDSE